MTLNDRLIQAAKNGDIEGVKKALQDGADVHYSDDKAFRLTADYGNYEAAKLLIENGANIHAMSNYALRWATCFGYTDIVRLLLEHGAVPQNDYTVRKLAELGFDVFGL